MIIYFIASTFILRWLVSKKIVTEKRGYEFSIAVMLGSPFWPLFIVSVIITLVMNEIWAMMRNVMLNHPWWFDSRYQHYFSGMSRTEARKAYGRNNS